MKAVKDMTTAELVAEYNALTGKSIKKFSTRLTAEVRVEMLRADGPKVEFTLAEAKAAEAAVTEDGAKALAILEESMMNASERPIARGIECPKCGSHEDSGSITANGEEGTAQAENFFCHHCSTAFRPNGKLIKASKPSADRATSVASSWANESVRDARRERTSVAVLKAGEKDELVFASVAKAFKALGISQGKVIKFRAQLKAAGKLELNGMKFSASTKKPTN